MSTLAPRAPQTASLLSTLTPARIQELAERMGLPAAQASPEKLKRQLAKKLSAERLIGMLSLTELQDICRQAGLGHSQGSDPERLRSRLLNAGRSSSNSPTQGRGGSAPSAAKQRAAARAQLPEELQRDLARKKRNYQTKRIAWFFNKVIRSVVAGMIGGLIGFGLGYILSTDDRTIETLAIAAGVTATVLKFLGRGRFIGALIFGGGFIGATYAAYDGSLDLILDAATPSRMAIAWTVALVVGVVLGISEELRQEFSA